MTDGQFEWMVTNSRIAILMATPFVVGFVWCIIWVTWMRRFGLRDLLFAVTYFALASGFALYLRYGRLMPVPAASPQEAESLEELR
jgi:hypothetical protein